MEAVTAFHLKGGRGRGAPSCGKLGNLPLSPAILCTTSAAAADIGYMKRHSGERSNKCNIVWDTRQPIVLCRYPTIAATDIKQLTLEKTGVITERCCDYVDNQSQ